VQLHDYCRALQVSPKTAAARDQFTKLFQGVQRKFQFVVLNTLGELGLSLRYLAL
jgi:hypothetical protein